MSKWIILILIVLAMISGCSTNSFHVERDGVTVDIDIKHLLQDKNFKSLSYDTISGVIKIEGFSSETSEVLNSVLDIVEVAGGKLP